MNLLVSNRLKGHSLLSLLPFKHSFSVSLIPDIVIPDTHPSTAIVLIEGIDDLGTYISNINAVQTKFSNSCAIAICDVDEFDALNEVTPLGPMRLYHVNNLIDAAKCIKRLHDISNKTKRALQRVYFEKLKQESENVSTARALMISALQAVNIKKDDCLLILESCPSIASIMTSTLEELKTKCPVDLSSLERCVSLFK